MIQFYKTSNDISKVDWIIAPLLCNSVLQTGPAQSIRGHKRRLSGQRTTSSVHWENSLANRAVTKWKRLPSNENYGWNSQLIQEPVWSRKVPVSVPVAPYNACSGPRLGRQPRNLSNSLLLINSLLLLPAFL